MSKPIEIVILILRIISDLIHYIPREIRYRRRKNQKKHKKSQVKENIMAHKEHHAEDHFIDSLIEAGISNMEVELPDAMVEEELNRMIRQYEENLKMQGLSLEQFYKFTNSDEASLKSQMKEEAEKRVKSRLLLEQIVKEAKERKE